MRTSSLTFSETMITTALELVMCQEFLAITVASYLMFRDLASLSCVCRWMNARYDDVRPHLLALSLLITMQ